MSASFNSLLPTVIAHTNAHIAALSQTSTTASPSLLRTALESLPSDLPLQGWGDEKTLAYLTDTLCGGLAGGQAGPRYWGFVTGGVLPIAHAADNLVTLYDQNLQVHLPTQSLSTVLESLTLSLLLSLLSLSPSKFPGRTFTTGATTSNVLGLACGREYTISSAHSGYSVAEDGLEGRGCRVFAAKAHASLGKAASAVGIGRRNVFDIGGNGEGGLAFDLAELERLMKEGKRKGLGLIVAAGFGEVNTGGFTPHIPELRSLCDKYGGWLHIDAAFGAFAALVPDLQHFVEHLQLADSITVDAHKWLNVPYDTAAFFTRHEHILEAVFGPSPSSSGPAYLRPPAGDPYFSYPAFEVTRNIPSPLNVGLENSRRFRALPVFAALMSLGKEGYTELVQRNVRFARRLGEFIASQEDFELLNPGGRVLLNVVLFRAKRVAAAELIHRINNTRRIYVSPTAWAGEAAVRIAISNWMTGVERLGEQDDLEIAKEVLQQAVRGPSERSV